MSILITGGAGFVGSSLARSFRRQYPSERIVVLDNLHRRGSELNLENFKNLNIEFVHGDIRSPNDLYDLKGDFDYFIEASAEPSVLAGLDGSPSYTLGTNLVGTLNCLEFARNRVDKMIFLSTSRVYSIPALSSLPLVEDKTRFEINETKASSIRGLSSRGIAEDFSRDDFRSLYGTTKLSSEMFIQEYCQAYNFKALINRCGVIAGPGQFGKVDQGVFTLWVANHFFERPLKYTGFGGTGKQVRDLLHPEDLFDLLLKQFDRSDCFEGNIYNIGGGREVSTSLYEYTKHCESVTGKSIPIEQVKESSQVDIPYYITDARVAQECFSWQPKRDVKTIVSDIYHWLKENQKELRPLFVS